MIPTTDFAVAAVVLLEVTPIVLLSSSLSSSSLSEDNDDGPPYSTPPVLTSYGVKEYFRRQTQEATLVLTAMLVGRRRQVENEQQFCIAWKKIKTKSSTDTTTTMSHNQLASGYVVLRSHPATMHDNEGEEYNRKDHNNLSLVYVPSEDPTIVEPQACSITAFVYQSPILLDKKTIAAGISPILVTDDTLVRILPLQVAISPPSNSPATIPPTPGSIIRQQLFLQTLTGDTGHDFLKDVLQEEVLQNHNPETIRELEWKMARILQQPIRIGTTASAFATQQAQLVQMTRMQQSLLAYREQRNIPSRSSIPSTKQNDTVVSCSKNNHFWWPSLIVHSPNHGDGKTMLVQAIAKKLECSSIHMIRPGVLLAKYGSQADAALETQLHSFLVSAACRNQKVCIVLDQMDMMMPPRLSGRSGAGDAAIPVLTAIASYLRNVTNSMQRRYQFPFPVKNVLYNFGDGGSGQVLTVHCCIVGIVTCPDDGWKSVQQSGGEGTGAEATILDCITSDRYKLTLLTADTRLSAFDAAFRREGICLDSTAQKRLSKMAASAAWAKGKVFGTVAQCLKQLLSIEHSPEAAPKHLQKAFAIVERDFSIFSNVSFETANASLSTDFGSTSFFASVGGNAQAKASLEDALALDPFKREILERFGLAPPTGVLLYGPPGCGKTLLAKAVASLLKSSNAGDEANLAASRGGTFISLAISEIVSSELGTSEKMIKSSFEFADKNAPSVIFLDEFQALFVDRARGGSGRLTTTLLQCLDDIKRWYDASSKAGTRVTVLAATNTPWMIDTAFLRPGRFDRVVHVGLPTEDERQSILYLHISQTKVQGRNIEGMVAGLCQKLASQTQGFSGADLAALCRAAAVRALFENSKATDVTNRHFLEALKTDIEPSSDNDLVLRLAKWRP